MKQRVLVYILLALMICSPVFATSYEEAKDMYLAGDYAGALPVFKSRLKERPKDAALNHWVGVCLMQTGEREKAVPYLKYAHKKKITEAPRFLAEIAFMDYKVDEALEYIDAYKEALKDVDKKMSDEVVALDNRIGKMRAMLDRVEKIEIIDSISVDADTFFEHYRIAVESGSINSSDIIPSNFDKASSTVVYMPESKTMMMWAMPDDNENYVLASSSLLSDGKWETPHVLNGDLNEGGDANYPFMMSDGITLYYANDGENSLGGYDIFISRRDDNEFLQPQNIGMPYNSPYNDYMLAIDEINKVGWWATDRNRNDGLITIYKFIPTDLRVNYPVDEPNLRNLAQVKSFRDTWVEDADYSEILAEIESIDVTKKTKKNDFRFALPGGREYTSWEDFKNPDARMAMEEYIDALNHYKDDCELLENLRDKYAKGDKSCGDAILSLEKKVRKSRISLLRLSNEVVKLEK